jgi:EthD domain
MNRRTYRASRGIRMIRLTYLLRRRPGLSLEAFQQYWREEHGPLVASHARHLNIQRYIQVHTIDNPDNEMPPDARGPMAKPYDGVAELWFTDREAIIRNGTSPLGLSAGADLLADEERFIDLKHSPGWFGYEIPQINPTPEDIVATENSPLVKFYYVFHHLRRQTLDEAQFYWRVHHGPHVRRLGPAIGAQRYLQVHRLEDELNTVFAQTRGTEVPPYSGHAELWFDRRVIGGNNFPEGNAARQALIDDEKNFIDFSRSSMWLAKESIFIEHS